MSNILPASKSKNKMIQEVLEKIHDQDGFSVLYEEKDLYVDLPEMVVQEEQEFFNVLIDLQMLETEIEQKYDIKEVHIKAGQVTWSPELRLTVVLS